MLTGLIGCKVGMTQVFDDRGGARAVTVLELGPCAVLKLCTVDRDGYSAVQLGYGAVPTRLLSRSEVGRLSSAQREGAAGVAMYSRVACEFELGDGYRVGDIVLAEGLVVGGFVDVVGNCKGRGFSGVIKRHNFGGVCASHGVKKVHRSGGSTGQSTDPGRVFKGTKMPGRHGGSRVTVKNLRVHSLVSASNLVLVCGAVPGFSGGYVYLRQLAN